MTVGLPPLEVTRLRIEIIYINLPDCIKYRKQQYCYKNMRSYKQ